MSQYSHKMHMLALLKSAVLQLACLSPDLVLQPVGQGKCIMLQVIRSGVRSGSSKERVGEGE